MSESMQSALEALREAIESFDGVTTDPQPEAGRPPQRGTVRDERRWRELDANLEATQIAGRRVLVVGDYIDFDALAYASRGASAVLACAVSESPLVREQREVTGETAKVQLVRLGWKQLDPARHGSFDIIHCDGILHRVAEPLTLLKTLRKLMPEGGTLVVGAAMISDPERSEYLRLIPARQADPEACWLVPGRLALRWLVAASGFNVEAEFGEEERRGGSIPLVNGYLRATAGSS